jgi:hypothetical protein
LRAASGALLGELGIEIVLLVAGCRPGALHQHGFEPLAPWRKRRDMILSALSLSCGRNPAHERKCATVGNLLISTTIFATIMPFAAILIAAAAEPGSDTNKSYWAGTTQARCSAMVSDRTRCNALQNITLMLVQDGTKITGVYTCAYVNQNCRDLQETGTIVNGSLKGNQLMISVQMPNRTSCRFTGLLSSDSGSGSYNCKGGSRPVERGSWRIHRSNEAFSGSTPQLAPLFRPFGN